MKTSFAAVLFAALVTGCASPTLPSVSPAAERAAPDCLERAAIFSESQPTAEEIRVRLDASGEKKRVLGFAETVTDNPETHTVPRPLTPPMPNFPLCASENGITGRCEVGFDVDETGKPQNVFALCSDIVFQREAIRAVTKAEFYPATIDGVPIAYPGVVYPIRFELADDSIPLTEEN